VLIVGLAVTAVLVAVSHTVYTRNEQRLLRLRIKDAESILTTALPGIQTPLASAAALADATNGNVKKFRSFIAPYVGQRPGQPFVSVSLWRLSDLSAGPKVIDGLLPELSPAAAVSFLTASTHTPQLGVTGLLAAPLPRIGYEYNTPASGRYVAYGESAVPKNRTVAASTNTAFSDLNFAIYLGTRPTHQSLLVASVPHLPVPGQTASVVVPFGSSALTLVMSPRRALSGSLPQQLPLIIALTGIVLTIMAAILSWTLAVRRRAAEHLARELERTAAENQQLYAEQRNIAQTLQHALLPAALPSLEGLETSARYVAGETGMDIGGDWYDVIPVTDRRVLVAVGDVSGRGLRAAASMASLRFAIHAYAVQGDSPAEILSKLSRLHRLTDTGQLATVLCAMIDLELHEVTIASAGHLPPLLVTDGGGEYLNGQVGVPIGVEENADYQSITVALPEGATLLAFTDGLVERRHETIDQGLARLRDGAAGDHATLTDLLTHVLNELRAPPAEDDTAIVGLRWTS